MIFKKEEKEKKERKKKHKLVLIQTTSQFIETLVSVDCVDLLGPGWHQHRKRIQMYRKLINRGPFPSEPLLTKYF